MVTPGTLSGRPADSHAVRPMSTDCGPIWETHPMMTSSIAEGSAAVLAISSVSTCAPRSAGCTPARPPFRLPTGVRPAPTMYASDTTTAPPLGHPDGRPAPGAHYALVAAPLGFAGWFGGTSAARPPIDLPAMICRIQDSGEILVSLS